MKNFTTLSFVFLLAISNTAGLAAYASEREGERLERAAQVFKEIMDAPDQTIPKDLLDRSHCIAIVPSMVKGGVFIVGGRYGRGIVCCRRSEGGWGPPSMVKMTGGSFGPQLGGAAVDVVMLVMNPSGIERLLESKFTLGGDVSVAAGPVGRAAAAETDVQMNAKILTYSRSRGVFAGLELKGVAFTQDRKANHRLYGQPVEARDLLVEGKASPPLAAQNVLSELAKASPSRRKKPL